jgi:hypothetical protein
MDFPGSHRALVHTQDAWLSEKNVPVGKISDKMLSAKKNRMGN